MPDTPEPKTSTPLYLPEGSIRAIIALSLIFSFIYLCITETTLPESLIATVGVIATFYFEQRRNGK